jgi:hypothetical protein
MTGLKELFIKFIQLIKLLLSWNFIKFILTEFFWSFPIYCLYLLVLGYAIKMLNAPKEDALKFLNYSFAFVVALSGLCFAWSACLNAEDKKKDKVTYSGERFFHSSILLLVATLLKFLVVNTTIRFTLFGIIALFYHLTIVFSITMAVGFFYQGLYTTSKYLWRNRKRHKDADYFSDSFSELSESNKNDDKK